LVAVFAFVRDGQGGRRRALRVPHPGARRFFDRFAL